MSRKTDQTPSGRKAKELSDALFRAGHWLPGHDNHRGANEGLGDREIKALIAENQRAYGRSWAESAIRERCRQAGYDC